jgi:tetratricopeptide (TPR) repeat protein
MMQCPKCQFENKEDANFCLECGEKLEIKCPQCGRTLATAAKFCDKCGHDLTQPIPATPPTPSPEPDSFVDDRYQVKEFLGEGGKKKVYLAHDTLLDRDVAFSLIKLEGLDEDSRTRITREAQAMGRLGSHPNIVTVFDLGDDDGRPYIVSELMGGGDVEDLIEKAPDHRLPLDQVMEIARSVCEGLKFAHAQGIIHRDLKPGNIWLTDDGIVKIGDFGLAMVDDRTRLTREGMMVGTVSYLSPEQAMGGAVTERSDLYSLGAMLYEMVTGRPPFVGDDMVAIVSQHLNTPPVSPTWHNPALSPAFETLILRLLEKSPDQRPISAREVLQALKAIETEKVVETPPEEAPTRADSPLYRQMFVGREAELKTLQSAFDDILSGKGELYMVVGEPGIGKTALCEQLATYVTLRGGLTLVGHCYEEGSLSLPYLAFVEAMRSYVLTHEADELRRELGSGASEVGRIVSEVRERLKVAPRPPGDPDEDRYRLMQAVTDFLGNAANVQPLLIILEDLHDADKGTLDMLTHIARNLSGMRLLIVGTYRDVEVDRAHPLSGALAELRRVSTYGRVLLRGLNADEVQRMLSSIAGEDVPWGLAEAVHRQTEGNPLFVQEVVRYLVEDGLVIREEGRWRTISQDRLVMSIPEGLRDVIGKRLSSLSPACNQLLSNAAIIGREFRLRVLQSVTDLSEDELYAALEEAKRAAVVEERSSVGATVTYRFSHAFFRQTLYEEMIAPRRNRLHKQVAQALEDLYATRLEEHAAELAEHFSHSTDHDDLAKAVHYGEMAAEKAVAVFDYGEAVRLLGQALQVQEVLDPENKEKRCDLLLELGDALIFMGEPRRVLDKEAPEAFSLAEVIGDKKRLSRTCLLAIMAIIYYGAGPALANPEAIEWTERANLYAEPGTIEHALAIAGTGLVKFWMGSRKEGADLLDQACNLSRQLGDPEIFWIAASFKLWCIWAPHRAVEHKRLTEELSVWSRVGVSTQTLQFGLWVLVNSFLIWGPRQRTEDIWDDIQELNKRTQQQHFRKIFSIFRDSFFATLKGDLELAIERGNYYASLGKDTGIAELAKAHGGVIFLRPRLYLGKADDTIPLFNPDLSESPVMRVLRFAYLGQEAEVAKMLEQFVLKRPDFNTTNDETPAWFDILFLEAAILTKHYEAVDKLFQRLEDNPFPTTGVFHTTCTARHLGAAALLLDRPDQARGYYQDALRVASEMRFRPEIALTRFQLAELLFEHYPDEQDEALEHLDFAIDEFREMKMQPSLERALALEDRIEG